MPQSSPLQNSADLLSGARVKDANTFLLPSVFSLALTVNEEMTWHLLLPDAFLWGPCWAAGLLEERLLSKRDLAWRATMEQMRHTCCPFKGCPIWRARVLRH